MPNAVYQIICPHLVSRTGKKHDSSSYSLLNIMKLTYLCKTVDDFDANSCLSGSCSGAAKHK